MSIVRNYQDRFELDRRYALCDKCVLHGQNEIRPAPTVEMPPMFAPVGESYEGVCVSQIHAALHPDEPCDPCRLYLLKQLSQAGWDELRAVIVAASSEEEARALAAAGACSEGSDVWFDSSRSSCSYADRPERRGVVLTDFKSG